MHKSGVYKLRLLYVSGLVFMVSSPCLHVCPFTPTTHQDAEVPSGHQCEHVKASRVLGLWLRGLSLHKYRVYKRWRSYVSGLVFRVYSPRLHICPFTPTTPKDAEVPSGHQCQHIKASRASGLEFKVQGLGCSHISRVYQLRCLYVSGSVFLNLLCYVHTSVPSPLPRTRTRRYHQDINANT